MKAERKLLSEANQKIGELIAVITRAHTIARGPLSDGVIDAFEALEEICEVLDPYSRKPFDSL